MHPIQWNRYIYCYVLPHWCLRVFVYGIPRTVTDWNALHVSTRAKQSTDSFKKALHKFPDTPCIADRCWAIIHASVRHSSSNGWSLIHWSPFTYRWISTEELEKNPCTRFWVILLTDRQTRAKPFTFSFVGGN